MSSGHTGGDYNGTAPESVLGIGIINGFASPAARSGFLSTALRTYYASLRNGSGIPNCLNL